MTTQPYLHNGPKTLRPQFKRPSTVPVPQQDPTITCAHTWKRYKKPIHSDNINFTHTAFFVVKLCEKCRKLVHIDYIIK